MRLNELLSSHYTQKSEIKNFTWATTNLVLMFLENTIRKHTQRPIFKDDSEVPTAMLPATDPWKPTLIPWSEFKQMIYHIYDHRL